MITVIGTGIAGLVCASMAKSRGLEVTIIELNENSIKNTCSWRAGGMLAPYCESEIAEQIILQLGTRSLELWPQFTKSLKTNGTIVLAPQRDNTSLTRFQNFTDGWEQINEQRLSELEPTLSQRFHSGLFYPNEGHLDPRVTLSELYLQLQTNCQIIAKNATNNLNHIKSGEWIIDCRGLAANDTFSDLRGVRGDMIIIRTQDLQLNRPIRLIHPKHPIYIVPREDNLFMIGATTIESESNTEMSVRSAGELLTQVYNLHPTFGEAEIVELNSGLRPAFPNNCPRITVEGNKISINGLYRHGFLLAPALAELTINYIQNGTSNSEVFNVN